MLHGRASNTLSVFTLTPHATPTAPRVSPVPVAPFSFQRGLHGPHTVPSGVCLVQHSPASVRCTLKNAMNATVAARAIFSMVVLLFQKLHMCRVCFYLGNGSALTPPLFAGKPSLSRQRSHQPRRMRLAKSRSFSAACWVAVLAGVRGVVAAVGCRTVGDDACLTSEFQLMGISYSGS